MRGRGACLPQPPVNFVVRRSESAQRGTEGQELLPIVASRFTGSGFGTRVGGGPIAWCCVARKVERSRDDFVHGVGASARFAERLEASKQTLA